MKTRILFLLFAFFSLSSCISDEERERQVNSAYQGKWFGTFSGDFNGSIAFTVDKSGTMDGETTVVPGNSKETIKGYVNQSGKFDMNSPSNLQFSGYLINSGSNGQWTKGNMKGVYTFQKH